jgi:hypothetical protein
LYPPEIEKLILFYSYCYDSGEYYDSDVNYWDGDDYGDDYGEDYGDFSSIFYSGDNSGDFSSIFSSGDNSGDYYF